VPNFLPATFTPAAVMVSGNDIMGTHQISFLHCEFRDITRDNNKSICHLVNIRYCSSQIVSALPSGEPMCQRKCKPENLNCAWLSRNDQQPNKLVSFSCGKSDLRHWKRESSKNIFSINFERKHRLSFGSWN
jgi:hypothetical protein